VEDPRFERRVGPIKRELIMSEMSQAQGPATGGVDLNPTDDMVPPGAPRDPDSPRNQSEFDGSEDVLPQDYGSEDVAPQETPEPPDPT
jgi:hypothetical protein